MNTVKLIQIPEILKQINNRHQLKGIDRIEPRGFRDFVKLW
jgi:hypothetical protein